MAYTAGSILVRAVMYAQNGLPADAVINDWAWDFGALAPSNAQLDDLFAVVGDFYRNGAGQDDRVGSYIGENVDRGATHLLQAYTITAGPLGTPRREMDWLGPTTASGAANLPTEVAGVLSFHANLTGIEEEVGPTRPRARRRGRVFIGPLNTDALNILVPAPTLSTAFRVAMQANAVEMAFNAPATWSVWSRADQLLRPVVGGWTDDAPDTQRRRGQAAASRSTFVLA